MVYITLSFCLFFSFSVFCLRSITINQAKGNVYNCSCLCHNSTSASLSLILPPARPRFLSISTPTNLIMSANAYGRAIIYQTTSQPSSVSGSNYNTSDFYNSPASTASNSSSYRDANAGELDIRQHCVVSRPGLTPSVPPAGFFVHVSTQQRTAKPDVLVINYNQRAAPSSGEPRPPSDANYYNRNRR